MTDRYAVSLFEQLFIPKPWVSYGTLARQSAVGSRQSSVAVVSRASSQASLGRRLPQRAGRSRQRKLEAGSISSYNDGFPLVRWAA